MTASKILDILESAKDDKGEIPMALVRKAFEKLPHWIPCSERLPEEKGLYLVTDHKGDVVRYCFNKTISSKEYWMRCARAWMPLPEPYREEKHDSQ